MSNVPPPSTAWQEQVDPGEAERFAAYAVFFARMQEDKSVRWGTGRALHRKLLAAAHGTLEVLDGLPACARHGLFATPRDYEAWVRLSNGGFDVAADRKPDIRGFGLRVFGVAGESALGGPVVSQDFTLINQENFGFARSDEFVDFVQAASKGAGALLRHMVKRYGVVGGPRRLLLMLGRVGKPFSGFATEAFYSAVPMAVGPYAARVRLSPASTNGSGSLKAGADWGADFAARLARSPLHWDLQLQFFTDEQATPIEDASANWSSPFTTVARLMLPRQDLASAAGKDLAAKVEASVIDPWQAMAEHRPLGEVQRARKVVYLASQKGRKAA